MTMQFRKQFKKQSQAGYMQSNKPQIMGGETGNRKMITQLNKHQSKQAEMQGNEVQNRSRESETPKMHAWQDKMSKTESQTGYMQSNKPQIMGGETENRKMITQLNKSHLKQTEMQGNEAKNRRQEAEAQKMHTWQDKMSKTESQSGEMMIKNIQNKKENAKNESMLSEQYIHKKNIIQTQSQSGRSMVEMLGVLAIIAILSIGGIVGYKIAMNYYQANQIANEINIMHNDLKIKYALGNEELLLGDPYDETYDETYDKTPDDERYRGYLSTQYNRYPVNYDCTRKDMQDFYSCREADAYFIKVKNISKGVCKPLTTLLNAMNGLIYMEINKEVYEKDDLCTSDENNEFYIEFDAEDVNGNYDSNRPEGWCADNKDCEGLSTPVCDKDNHECVECTEEDNTHCALNICRDDHTCGECTKDSDCANPRPICDEEAATCVRCNNSEECAEINANTPICETNSGACCDDPLMTWNGSECACPADYGVSETTQGKICLPYCEKNNIGIILMTDTSGSMTLQMFENANKAKEELHIPEDIPSAVYWCAACYDANCLKNTPSGPVNEHLSYGKHSVSEIRAALQTNVSDRLKVTGDFGGSIYKIIDYCSTIKEKLIIIVWWDNQKPADTGNDIPAFKKLKEKCPETVIYNVSPNAKSFASADKSFDLNDITTEYTEVLNQFIQKEGCVERK